MTLLTATDLGHSIGPLDVFAGVSLSVPPRARIGLVGPNGVGKTTLLRILAGLETPTEGQVFRARDLTIGFLPQEASLHARHSLWDEALTAFTDLRAMEAEIQELERSMGDPDRSEEAIARYGPLQEEFERLGGYTYPSRMRRVLGGLGFAPDDFGRPISKLSGGQRTRALLARLLLASPDLLILDEPTNHLDIEAVEWLESYLRDWPGAAVTVSHDRYFLDRAVEEIWELSPLGFETYRGDYTAYLQQRQERWDHRQQLFESEIARLENELDYIRRHIAGQRTLQARGKLRRLSRQVEALEQLGVAALQGQKWSEISQEVTTAVSPMGVNEAERRLRALRDPTAGLRPPDIQIHLREIPRSGDLVLRTRSLAVGYPRAPRPLFRAPDLELRRGECAAVIGPNGAGKTTLLKTILGTVPPREGEIVPGASLKIGYFAQAHGELNPQNTLVGELAAVSPGLREAEARDLLARFQFVGEEPFKQVRALSGGERGRLALAKLFLADSNFLLLDEPTNHLDIPSQEVLQSVLESFEGTLLLVSHDRYLINALATQIWEILPRERGLRVFDGPYSQFRAQKEAEARRSATEAREAPPEPGGAPGRPSPPDSPSPSSRLSVYRRKIRLQELETRIADLETHLASISNELQDPPANPEEVRRLGERYVEVDSELNALIREWQGLQEG